MTRLSADRSSLSSTLNERNRLANISLRTTEPSATPPFPS
jgi:hypothetical protein